MTDSLHCTMKTTMAIFSLCCLSLCVAAKEDVPPAANEPAQWESRSTAVVVSSFPLNFPADIVTNSIGNVGKGLLLPFYYPDEAGWGLAFIFIAPFAGVYDGTADAVEGRFPWEAHVFQDGAPMDRKERHEKPKVKN